MDVKEILGRFSFFVNIFLLDKNIYNKEKKSLT